MKTDILRQTTRPISEILDLAKGFLDCNKDLLEEMLLNYLEDAGEIENTYDLSESELILINRIDNELFV